MTEKVILVTDDDADDRFFLTQAIERKLGKITIMEANGGQEAMAFLKASLSAGKNIDLIVLDMNMPGMNGLELLDKMNTITELLHTPTVMLSTSNEPEMVQKAYSCGINSYIKKPTSMDEYDGIVEALQVCFLSSSK